jgi:4-oxalocrotonate tautomerase
MPFVRIDLIRGKPVAYRKALGEIVYQAMTDLFDVQEGDKFQVITEHAPEELNVSEGYLDNHYSNDVILIQVTLSFGRVDRAQEGVLSAGRRRQLCPAGSAAG